MFFRHRAGRSLQGLSGVGNVCVWRDIPEIRALLCGFVNSNGILCNQEHPTPSINGVFLCSFPPFEITEDLCVPFHLLLSVLFFFFGLWICFGWYDHFSVNAVM